MPAFAMIFAAALAAAWPSQPQAGPSVQDMISKFESSVIQDLEIGSPAAVSLAERLKILKIPGMSIAVVKDFAVEWAKGYGVRSVKTGEPVDADTLFQSASITKSISAAVALRLVQDGVLELDVDVNRYLKRWRVPENEFTKVEKVTLRRILSHTAGLTVSGMPSYAEGHPVPMIIQVLDGLPPAHNVPVRVDRIPGTEYRYSGGGYTILQVLIEDVTSRPLPALAAEIVFKPAGMTRSIICLCNAPDLAGQAALGHNASGASFPGEAFLQGGSGCCELWTTATDLARYIIALQKSARGEAGAILSPSTARTMMTLEREGGRALGLSIRRYGDTAYFLHNGGNVGFVGRFIGHPEKGYGLAVLINTDAAGPMLDDMTVTIAGMYGWDGVQPTRYKDTAALLDELRGRWTSGTSSAGNSETVLSRQGNFILQCGYPEAGIAVLRLMVELNPRSASAADFLAGAYARIGDKGRAIEHYRLALELFKKFPEENTGDAGSRDATLDKIRKLDGGLKK